jgi:hypothetical protein
MITANKEKMDGPRGKRRSKHDINTSSCKTKIRRR